MSEGVFVRAWRYLFARDSHEECRKALEHQRAAYQWQMESTLKMLADSHAKALEMADPGINYRFQAQPKPKPPVEPKKKDPSEIELLPITG